MFLLVHTPVVSASEYLERERLAEYKSELNNGIITQMAGTSPIHVFIAHNLDRLLGNFAEEYEKILVSGNDLKVCIPMLNTFVYPDITVANRENFTLEDEIGCLETPLLIFEILSPSTEMNDRGWKFEAYRAIPSLQEYILVAQNRCHIEQYSRNSSNQWLLREYSNPQDFIQFTSIPFQLELTKIYKNTNLL